MHSQKALPRPELSAHHHLLLSPDRFDLIGWRSQHGSLSHASPAAPIWQVTSRRDGSIKNATSLRWSQSESFSSSKGIFKGAHRSGQTTLDWERWAPYPHDHFSFHWVPAFMRVSASLSHNASSGLILLLQLHWSSSFRVCRLLRPPSIWDTSILLPFPVSNSSARAGQAGLPLPIRPSYLQALGPQQLAWSNCLIAIPDGSYQQPTSP